MCDTAVLIGDTAVLIAIGCLPPENTVLFVVSCRIFLMKMQSPSRSQRPEFMYVRNQNAFINRLSGFGILLLNSPSCSDLLASSKKICFFLYDGVAEASHMLLKLTTDVAFSVRASSQPGTWKPRLRPERYP